MKKRIFKIFCIIIGLAIILLIYINSPFFIESQEWKYSEGTHIGDWLEKNTFEVNKGIIHTNGSKARIIFSFGHSLIIQNIDTNERGIYINKK